VRALGYDEEPDILSGVGDEALMVRSLASNVRVTITNAPAARASDTCTVTRLPTSPTVMPLNARRPPDDMLKSPSTRPRIAEGAVSCAIVCAMLLNESSKKPAMKSSTSASA
jgi:hypothetical protein